MIVRVAYAAIMIGAVLAASWLVRKQQSKLPLTPSQRLALGLSAFIGCMLGAKAPFLLQLGWEGLWRGTVWFADGKTILGGIVGGYLAVEITKPIVGIRFSTGDSFALPAAVAIMMGRLGCFVAGCCFGTPTDLPWGIEFPLAGDDIPVPRHPTQLYEVIFHALAAIVLYATMDSKRFAGNKLKIYLIIYFAFRFFTEFLRPEPAILLGLTGYQWTSLALILILLILSPNICHPYTVDIGG
ncbi:MAG: prolipoprotein diacylglyceryl transferase family protein [Pirellulales bacterium]